MPDLLKLLCIQDELIFAVGGNGRYIEAGESLPGERGCDFNLVGLGRFRCDLRSSTYSMGELRKHLQNQNITAYIPFSPHQKKGIDFRRNFEYHEEYLICPEGKKLKRGKFQARRKIFRYGASQKDCQVCPRKEKCLYTNEKRKQVKVSVYYPEIQQAVELNETQDYAEQIRKRKTIIEGVFACQDRLGWSRCKLRGMWKVDW